MAYIIVFMVYWTGLSARNVQPASAQKALTEAL